MLNILMIKNVLTAYRKQKIVEVGVIAWRINHISGGFEMAVTSV